LRIYADTSFLVSIYLTDAHSREADQLFKSSSGLLCTPLHLVEFAHSIEQNIFRHRISAGNARRIYLEFERDRRAGLWHEEGQPELTFAVSADLARTHTATLGTRTLDTLHVAAALELKAERFWTFDERQAELAKAVGLKGN
jgi:predicted nucleic acid-binding protein